MLNEQEAHTQALDWLDDERHYTLQKFGSEVDRKHTIEFFERYKTGGMDNEGWWEQQFDNYLGRAGVLGLDTPGGRQALAKFVATGLGMLSAAIQVYGDLPSAGVPSGVIQMIEEIK